MDKYPHNLLALVSRLKLHYNAVRDAHKPNRNGTFDSETIQQIEMAKAQFWLHLYPGIVDDIEYHAKGTVGLLESQ